jgi:tetratricopeptide (TPR) repeat protein
MRRIARVVALLVLAFATPAGAQSTATALEEGERLERAYDFEHAYQAYREAARADTTTYELWWRLAKAASDRGQRFEFDGKKAPAEAAYAEAVMASRRAVRIDPRGWEGHSGLAANLGRLALFEGGKTKIRMSREVKVEADRALELNPRDDRAMHVLARWHRAIARLSFFERTAAKVVYGGVPEGASMNDAVTLFERAIAIAPDYANHRLELGRTYLALGLKDKAREQLERATKCPTRSPFDDEYRAEAQLLLRKAR